MPPRSEGIRRSVWKAWDRSVAAVVAERDGGSRSVGGLGAARRGSVQGGQARRTAARRVAALAVIVVGRAAMAVVFAVMDRDGAVVVVVVQGMGRDGIDMRRRRGRYGLTHHRHKSKQHENGAEDPHGRTSFSTGGISHDRERPTRTWRPHGPFQIQSLNVLRRSALAMTDTELNDMASAATTGLSRIPNVG